MYLCAALSSIRCQEGIMDTNAFVIDTKDTNIVGEGFISLEDETIKMKLSPKPKEITFPSLRTPVHIAGTFKDPTVYPDKMLAMRVGAAVVLGVLATPLASLIPLIEIGTGEDANCRALIAVATKPQPPKHTKQSKRIRTCQLKLRKNQKKQRTEIFEGEKLTAPPIC